MQTRPGSRIRVIYESGNQNNFGIEFFEEAAARKGLIYETKIVKLEEIIADEEIARKSIYDYLENTLKMKILTSKRCMTAELATTEDKSLLELDDYNCLVIISGRVYNADGIQFEYTESRHRPDYFCFEDTATRHRNKLR